MGNSTPTLDFATDTAMAENKRFTSKLSEENSVWTKFLYLPSSHANAESKLNIRNVLNTTSVDSFWK